MYDFQAAQDALNAYFKRMVPMRRSQGSSGMSAGEKQLKIERRKSMPSFSPDSVMKGRKRSPLTGQPCPPEGDLSWRNRTDSSTKDDRYKKKKSSGM